MTAKDYHAWLIVKLDSIAQDNAHNAFKAKESGDIQKHEFLARCSREARLVQMYVETLNPIRADYETPVSKS